VSRGNWGGSGGGCTFFVLGGAGYDVVGTTGTVFWYSSSEVYGDNDMWHSAGGIGLWVAAWHSGGWCSGDSVCDIMVFVASNLAV
jgi:hypothetical protein